MYYALFLFLFDFSNLCFIARISFSGLHVFVHLKFHFHIMYFIAQAHMILFIKPEVLACILFACMHIYKQAFLIILPTYILLTTIIHTTLVCRGEMREVTK
jgi:hypothetical protein